MFWEENTCVYGGALANICTKRADFLFGIKGLIVSLGSECQLRPFILFLYCKRRSVFSLMRYHLSPLIAVFPGLSAFHNLSLVYQSVQD